MRKCIALLVVFCLISGCATGSHRPVEDARISAEHEGRCAPPSHPPPLFPLAPLSPQPESAPRNEGSRPAVAGFSAQTTKIAQIIGIDRLLERLVALHTEQAQGREGAHVAMLEVRQEISDRLLLTILDVASVSAEVKCERERADQLGDHLEEQRDRRIMQLTIFAILGGALVGILSGALNLANQDTAAAAGAIAGGVLETAFGSAAMFYETRHDFRHRRNLLQEVWSAPPQSTLFPDSVWRYLNSPSDPPLPNSLREAVVSEWRRTGRLGEPGSKDEQRRLALLFSPGGSYTVEELRARAAMLDLLAAHIDLMSQDLNVLVRELSSLRNAG